METYRPWKRNYPIPDDLPINVEAENSGMAGWRTERLENPEQVFIDIYGLLDYLTRPGNMQLRGRRGTGKTMYFLKSQYQLGQAYLPGKQNEILAVYVDLKDINQHNEIPSFILRAEMIYRDIIKAITFGFENQQGIHRYNISDYLNQLDFTKRWSANNTLKILRELLGQPIEDILPGKSIDDFCETEYQIIHREKMRSPESDTSQAFNERAYMFSRSLIEELRNIENGNFVSLHSQIKNALLKLLDSVRAKSLNIFIDELSSPTVLQGIQIPLIDRLVTTFAGERLSIKIATVPGTSIIYENVKDRQSDLSATQKSFTTFDFESQSLKNPDIIETGNFEVFLRNLANAESKYRPYLNSSHPEEGFDHFLEDTFENYEDFLEFIKAGEGLPRQMLETFFNANNIRKNLNPKGKLTSLHIQMASRQSLQITYQAQILGSKKCEDILAKIYQINNRVIKIERIPEYNNAVDLLTHWGFIHACPIPPTQEPELSKYPLEYFYTSYRMEIANQMSHAGEKVSQGIDDLSTIQKDKLKELYPKSKAVILS